MTWTGVLICVGLWTLINGPAFTDFRDFRQFLSAWHTVTLPPDRQFLYSSPFYFIAGYVFTPLGDAAAYSLVAIGGLFAMAAALYRYLNLRFGKADAPQALTFMLWSPLLMVILQWIGKSDTYLVAFFLWLLSTDDKRLHALLGFLMMLCHRELAMLMLLFSSLADKRLRLWAFAGALASMVLMAGYHHLILDHPPVNRIDYVASDLMAIPSGNVHMLAAMLLFSLSYYWIYIVAFSRITLTELVLLLGSLLIGAMTLDFTRVFALLSLPLVLSTLQRGYPAAKAWRDRKGVWAAALIAVLPGFQLINFEVVGSRIHDDLILLKQAIDQFS